MPQCPPYATTVIGAHNVSRWYEARDVGLSGGINGRQRAKEARKRSPTLKALLTSGYAPNATLHECRLGLGVELRSPFTQAALSGKLRDINSYSTPARVLVVEDEALVQVLAREYLEECALKIDVASTAAEAPNKRVSFQAGLTPGRLYGPSRQQGDSLVREVQSIGRPAEARQTEHE
jgi:hypothetical protein